MSSPGTHDLRTLIDGVLRADKTLAGFGFWSQDHREHCERWSRPLEIAGELRGMQLEVKAYAAETSLKFRILLTEARCVWRLDFADDGHVNPLDAPVHKGMAINGPHYHAWVDNRRYARPNSLPAKLRIARILPQSIRTFTAAFRWFCSETNIYVATADIPELPKRGLLV